MSITQDEKFKGDGDNLTKKDWSYVPLSFSNFVKSSTSIFLLDLRLTPIIFFSHI